MIAANDTGAAVLRSKSSAWSRTARSLVSPQQDCHCTSHLIALLCHSAASRHFDPDILDRISQGLRSGSMTASRLLHDAA